MGGRERRSVVVPCLRRGMVQPEECHVAIFIRIFCLRASGRLGWREEDRKRERREALLSAEVVSFVCEEA